MQLLLVEDHPEVLANLYSLLQLSPFSLVELEARLSASMRQADWLAITHATC